MFTFVLGQGLLPTDSVKIGRFIVDIDEPQSDYFDPSCGEPTVRVSTQLQYNATVADGESRGFSLALTRLVSSAHSKRNKSASQISTDRVETYKLDNSTEWFLDAVKLPGTRKWIERVLSQGDAVYLVVGYHTFTNAVIKEHSATLGINSASVKVPVTTALALSGGVIPLGVADPTIGGQGGHQAATDTAFVAEGEQICAIQYRKLNFKWYSSKNLDRASLDSANQWRTYVGVRGQEDVPQDDVLQAELTDGDEPEAGDWERIVLDGGEVFIV